jgi:hypothetical protein
MSKRDYCEKIMKDMEDDTPKKRERGEHCDEPYYSYAPYFTSKMTTNVERECRERREYCDKSDCCDDPKISMNKKQDYRDNPIFTPKIAEDYYNEIFTWGGYKTNMLCEVTHVDGSIVDFTDVKTLKVYRFKSSEVNVGEYYFIDKINDKHPYSPNEIIWCNRLAVAWDYTIKRLCKVICVNDEDADYFDFLDLATLKVYRFKAKGVNVGDFVYMDKSNQDKAIKTFVESKKECLIGDFVYASKSERDKAFRFGENKTHNEYSEVFCGNWWVNILGKY